MRCVVGIILLTTSVLFSSCSATWHLNRAIKKDPSLLQTDTIAIVDTVVTEPVTLQDTLVLSLHDTILLTKEKLKVKIVRSFDTIKVDAICEADTVIRVVEVPAPSIVMKDSDRWYNKVYKFSFYLLLLLLLALYLRVNKIL